MIQDVTRDSDEAVSSKPEGTAEKILNKVSMPVVVDTAELVHSVKSYVIFEDEVCL